MRLIDADKIQYTSIAHLASYPVAPSPCDTVMRAEINAIPTVDAEPVRHGKWFIGTVPYFVCSECKNRTPLRWDERCGYVLDYRSPYCPYCGAKMDAEREEE